MADILIIGGGVAGLSAGIFARLRGHRAVICERHAVPGGCLSTWERKGFHIDNCIHWLTGTNPHSGLYGLWKELGVLGGASVYKKPYLYVTGQGADSLALGRSLPGLHADMLAASPEDREEIDRFIRAVDTVQRFMGIAGAEHNERLGAGRTLAGLPGLVRYYGLSIAELSARFQSPLLRGFFTSFLPGDFGSLALIFVIANFCGNNADIPLGGSAEMARRMTERYEALGGTLLTRKEAVSLREEDGRTQVALFSDGSEQRADYIIVTLDPSRIFGRLLKEKMPKQLRQEYGRLTRFSACQCAFGLEAADAPFKGDYSLPLTGIFREKLKGERLILRNDDHEESYAPEGKALIQTMIYCGEPDAKGFIDLRRENRDEYKKKKQELGALTAEAISDHFPGLKNKLQLLDVWTPATYRRYVDSEIGSFMSFAMPKGRLPIKLKNRVPGRDRILLAGQWLQMPGGLPIAAATGRDAVEAIDRMERG